MKTLVEFTFLRKGQRWLIAVCWIFLISFLLHFPRLFFISDEAFRATGKESLLSNFPTFCKWDCGFYHYLANQAPLSKGSAFAAFFPLFPLILRGLHQVFPATSLAALSVAASNFFSLSAICVVIILGRAIWSPSDSSGNHVFPRFGKPAILLGLAVAVYPHSQFFSYGYSEPLFLLFYACTLVFFFKKRLGWSAVSCGLASICRPQGLWLLGAFLGVVSYQLIKKWFFSPKGRTDTLVEPREVPLSCSFLVLFLASIPFLIFVIWQWHTFGSPLAFLHAQSGWNRHLDVIGGLRHNIPKFDQCKIFNTLALIATWRFLKRPELHWKLLALVTVMMTEIPLFFGGTYSYPRFSALNLGVFIFLVELSKDRFWLIVALLLLAVTRLDVEIHSWMTSNTFLF